MMNRTLYKVKRLLRMLREQGCGGILYRLKRQKVRSDRAQCSFEKPADRQLDEIRIRVSALDVQPLISVLMPVYNTPVSFLHAAIESVRNQIYEQWELCIADDASTDAQVRDVLQSFEEQDSRIRVVYRPENGHIAKTSQSALEIAKGDLVALLDHDDELSPDALARVALKAAECPGDFILYTNEAKIDEEGCIFDPTDKPVWSPNYFYRYMYTGHLTVYRKSLIEKAGGFRPGFEGSQDYDLLLRALRHNPQVSFLPEILYYWRECEGSVAADRYSKLYAYENARKSLEENLPALEPAFLRVEEGLYPGVSRIRYRRPENIRIKTVDVRRKTVPEELTRDIGQADYIFFQDVSTRAKTHKSEPYLLEALQAKDVVAVTPLLLSEDGSRVECAGYRKDTSGFYPRFQGVSAYEGGEGMQLATGGEVAGAPISNMLVKASAWSDFLSQNSSDIRDIRHLEELFCESVTRSGKRVYYCSQAVYLKR